jgi:TonB family protein
MNVKTIACTTLLLVAACPAEDKALQDKLRAQFLNKTVTLRGFYSDSDLKYGPDGHLVSKSATGPWTLDGKIEITGLKITDKALKISGNRIWVWWSKSRDNSLEMQLTRSPHIVDIEGELGPTGEAAVPALLKDIFIQSGEAMSDLVPELWKDYLAGKTTAWHAPSNSGKPEMIRISQGVAEGHIVKKVGPEYPALAKAARLQGAVVLHALIGKDGDIRSLRVKQPLGLGVEESAANAVSQWRYKPTTLNGDPVEVDTQITINYQLR